VVVNNSAMPNSRWYTGSGIYRNVKVLKADPLHIRPDGLRITTRSIDGGYAVIDIDLVLENTSRISRKIDLSLVLKDPGGEKVANEQISLTVYGGETTRHRRRLTVEQPRLWSPDSPDLYQCECCLTEHDRMIDLTTADFGIRLLDLDPRRGLRINGQNVKLRGTCIHHDNGVIGAVTLERAEQRRAELIKAAGFNAIRSAHHPMSKAMLDACDRIGLLVMDEAFDIWDHQKSEHDYALYFREWWSKDVEAMVSKDFNHPCVILYSIGNEIPEAATPQGARLARQMAEKIRELDQTRFITNGLNGFFTAMPIMGQIMAELAGDGILPSSPGTGNAGEINQLMMNYAKYSDHIMRSRTLGEALAEACDALDVAGYNYMSGRYRQDGERYPHRVIVGSETFPTRIGLDWPQIMACPHVIGDFTWVGFDYLGEAGCGAYDYEGQAAFFKPYPARLAFSGDIDITGHRRPMSFFREIVFGFRKDPYIAVQRVNRYGQAVSKTTWAGSDTIASWTWPGYEGQPAVIEVFSSAEEVELFSNGQSLGRQPAGTAHNFTAVFETTYQPGSIVAVSYTGGQQTGQAQLMTAGPVCRLQATADQTHLLADGADLSFISIALSDVEGCVNLSEQRQVTVSIEGPGTLQGFGSADPYGTEDFFSETKTTFDGRLLAVVRSTDTAGEIKVTLTAPGCNQSVLILKSSEIC